MRIQELNQRKAHLLMLDPGDEVFARLTEFAQQHSIEGASFSGIGAFERATIAWWNRQTKEYEPIEIGEQVEVLTITGSVARSPDGDVKIHAHVILGRRGGAAIGGHLLAGRVFPTLEVFVSEYATGLRRHRDVATGMWLLDL